MASIYKYFDNEAASKIFTDDTFSLKFSFLSEYNDPYEFFLTVGFDKPPDELAFYLEMVNMQTARLATCFSNTPINTPMWAHYGNNSKGFVLELDEDALITYLEGLGIPYILKDVAYKDVPDDGLEDLLARAFQIGKFRYIDMLQRRLVSVAYFTKQSCWLYEQEKRLLLPPEVFDADSNLKLFTFPSEVITAIIIGNKASEAVGTQLRLVAESIHAHCYMMRPAKISPFPFFVCPDGFTYTFKGSGIVEHNPACGDCNEPLAECCAEKCPWCSMTDTDRDYAAGANSFRVLQRHGLLGGYLEATRKIHGE